MLLTEAEGKELLREAGIPVPDFFLLRNSEELPKEISFPVILKAQTLMGGRGKAGLVKQAADSDELKFAVETLWKAQYQKRPFDTILIEPRLDIAREYYVSVTYDTTSRMPAFILSKFGGMDIELVAKRQPESIINFPINPLEGLRDFKWGEFFTAAEVKEDIQKELRRIYEKLYDKFLETDAELVEINPLIEAPDGALIAADAKVTIDDTSLYRHEFSFPNRSGFRELTEMEKAARAIDARSHRGVVGRTFLELDGDIGFMSSGGGASITCLDALISYGGRPANFTEYSGNPEREDVYELTKLILSISGLKGLWVVGPTANFTDIYETLGGIVDALKEIKPSFPIVIRRAGPRDTEAKEMVEALEGLDIIFFGEEISMTESAKILIDKIKR